ncbi:conserved hypothetical protein [Desulforapulum autotrophicum HRM2]|nr:conserved hypothetical protein [Desulforapulum autotrophicum HRM2]
MICKKMFSRFVILTFMCGLSFYSWAEDSEDAVYDFKIDVGYHYANDDESISKVGEYNILDHTSSGPDMDISGKVLKNDLFVDFSSRYYHDSDFNGRIKGDYKRIIEEDFSYSSFEHFLDHDNMSNLCGKTGAVVVNHEDFNAGKDYIIRRSEEKSDTTINLPFSPGTDIHFSYRRQRREGLRQAMTMSHCGTCHVTSNSREINEETEDYKAGFSKKFSIFTLAYDYFHREFTEHGAPPTNTYDDPTHPGGSGDIFDDRIQYGDDTLVYDLVPSMKKNMHTAKLNALLPANTNFFASYVFSNTENKDADLETDTTTATIKVTNQFFPGWRLSGHFKYQDIDNDDVFVDVTEPVSTEGLNSGYTWYLHNPTLDYNSFDPDYIRESALSRKVTTLGFDARYQVLKKTSLIFGYERETVDRKYYAVTEDGDTESTTDTYKLSMTTRPCRGVKLRLGYQRADTDNPFNLVNGACESDFITDSGGAFNGTQYWERQNERIGDLSNQPTLAQEISGDMTWSAFRNFSVTANYRFIDKENDETDVSDWQSQSHIPSISITYVPLPKIDFNVSYIFDRTKTETLANIPVFDG